MNSSRKVMYGVLAIIAFFLILIGSFYYFVVAGPSFSEEKTIVIEPGQSVRSLATELKNEGIIKSITVVQSLVVFFGGERGIKTGLYVFKRPQNALTIVKRVIGGEYGFTPIKVTIPEGTNSTQLAEIIHAKFPHIATSTFEVTARSQEGFLFPETYFFSPIEKPEIIIKKMADTFEEKIKPFLQDIKNSGKSKKDIIIAASIVEEEVRTQEDKKMVADLLWRRLSSGMALQVDATLAYVLNKTSAELSLSDLKDQKNIYNTYSHKGLPPTPISNPGIESIDAVLHPTPNEYLFYLSDKDGITHFAKTYNEHLANKKKYLQ